MLHLIFATAIDMLKDIMSVFGAVAAIGATVVGVWLTVRKRTEAKLAREHQDDVDLSAKFARLETTVQHLQTTVDSVEHQYTEFRDRAVLAQQELVKDIDELRERSRDSHRASNIQTLRQDMVRVESQVKRLNVEFSRLRDLVVDKYLTLSSYQNDLILWTKTYDNLQQNLRDVQLALNTKR